MLREHLELKAFIAPPQIYELSRLANFRDYASLLDFAIKREKYGIERWSYQINGMQDGKRKNEDSKNIISNQSTVDLKSS